MPIALIIAIIQLIIKLPDIVHVILEIIEKIHDRPLHLQGHLITKLHQLVVAACQTCNATEIKDFHSSLVP